MGQIGRNCPQAQNNNLSDIIRDFKNFTSHKFLEIMESGRESRSDWMKVVLGYHGKFINKQTYQVWKHEIGLYHG